MKNTRSALTVSFFIILALSRPSFAAKPEIIPELMAMSNNIYYFMVTFKDGGAEKKIPIDIVNYEEQNVSNIIWILHGYKPVGDPYLQSPGIIIRNWRLTGIARQGHSIIFLPDMGRTVYSFSDIGPLYGIFSYFSRKFPGTGIIISGISTGSEGAVKLGSLCAGKVKIICLSGTFDYSLLKPTDGEYRIHRGFFIRGMEDWNKENPLNVLRAMSNAILYIFTEENSIYARQSAALNEAHLTNIQIVDKTQLGKGFRHGWGFWESPAVLSNISIIFKTGIH